MPETDGMGVIRAIRELKPDLPIIIASGSEGDKEELQRQHAAPLQYRALLHS